MMMRMMTISASINIPQLRHTHQPLLSVALPLSACCVRPADGPAISILFFSSFPSVPSYNSSSRLLSLMPLARRACTRPALAIPDFQLTFLPRQLYQTCGLQLHKNSPFSFSFIINDSFFIFIIFSFFPFPSNILHRSIADTASAVSLSNIGLNFSSKTGETPRSEIDPTISVCSCQVSSVAT